ncbi:unnamed protein product, partial [Linum tenue]
IILHLFAAVALHTYLQIVPIISEFLFRPPDRRVLYYVDATTVEISVAVIRFKFEWGNIMSPFNLRFYVFFLKCWRHLQWLLFSVVDSCRFMVSFLLMEISFRGIQLEQGARSVNCIVESSALDFDYEQVSRLRDYRTACSNSFITKYLRPDLLA